ncbi:hypothetical protein KQ51_00363 [Candidatus Izimaplasma bacterium HR1]|jgi:hypothetical protein|uniref:hypothetical protein n=1 Tax=Candidatus Izimoplasma sp. HR1 TaxID=1541959 RepID=UPI0004F79355|nr:hypothetical protein KQ51_00363 [Candidatus Izimaplasma bacterium HR1]
MKNKRGFKHYLRFWMLATVLYSAYVIFISSRDGMELSFILSAVYLPIVFTFLLFAFDTVFDRIWPQKDKKSDQEFDEFLKKTTYKVNEELELSIEDFRRLRENEKFQKSLYQVYQIYLIGETEEINFIFLEKKFKKDTTEYVALEIVVKEVKKMMVN